MADNLPRKISFFYALFNGLMFFIGTCGVLFFIASQHSLFTIPSIFVLTTFLFGSVLLIFHILYALDYRQLLSPKAVWRTTIIFNMVMTFVTSGIWILALWTIGSILLGAYVLSLLGEQANVASP